MKLRALPFIAFCVACLTNLSSARAEPDEDVLGKALGYPVGDPSTMYSEPNRVGSFSAADKSRPSRRVLKGGWTQPLNKRSGLDDTRYRLLDAQISSFLERNRTTGLLIIKDDKVLVERYRYGRTEESHFYSASASKSIVSLLIGIAIDRKIIASYDDTADRYVPELKASAFGTTSIRNLLRMSSGVRFSESVEPNRNPPSDFQIFSRVQRGVTPGKPLEFLARYSERDFPQGEKFEYITANTAVLGYVLRNATGKTLADLTAEWLWGSLGAERDAFWLTTSDGMEEAGGGFNATLRDWGRLGVLLANDGKMNGVQVVPKQFLFDATEISRQPPAFRPGYEGRPSAYGYQFWLYGYRSRTFTMSGAWGQRVFVQPASGLVMVHTGVWKSDVDAKAAAELNLLWDSVLRSAGGYPQ